MPLGGGDAPQYPAVSPLPMSTGSRQQQQQPPQPQQQQQQQQPPPAPPAVRKRRLELQTNASIGEKGKIALTLPDGGPNRNAPGWTVPFVVAIHGNDAPPESFAFEPGKQRMVQTGRVARAGADYRFADPGTGPWHDGDIHSHDWFWEPLSAELGEVALVQVSHRPASEAAFPKPYDDVLNILRWLYAHATEYHLDRERCVLVGASSGAHIAALVATRGTKEQRQLTARAQRQGSQPPDPLPNIRGVVTYAGILDLLALYDKGTPPSFSRYFTGPPGLKRPLLSLMSGAVQVGHVDRTGVYKSASPLEHVHPDTPPMFLVHGDADELVPISQSRAMVAELRSVGLEPTLFEVADAPHFAMNGDQPLPWEQLEAKRSSATEQCSSADSNSDSRKRFVCESELLDFLRTQLRIDELAGETPQQRAARVEAELLAKEIARQSELEQKTAKLLMSAPRKPRIRLERTLIKQ